MGGTNARGIVGGTSAGARALHRSREQTKEDLRKLIVYGGPGGDELVAGSFVRWQGKVHYVLRGRLSSGGKDNIIVRSIDNRGVSRLMDVTSVFPRRRMEGDASISEIEKTFWDDNK